MIGTVTSSMQFYKTWSWQTSADRLVTRIGELNPTCYHPLVTHPVPDISVRNAAISSTHGTLERELDTTHTEVTKRNKRYGRKEGTSAAYGSISNIRLKRP